MLDLFEVLRRLISSHLFGGVFGGDSVFRKLKGTLLGVNSSRGIFPVSLRLLLRRFNVISALTTSVCLFELSKCTSTVCILGIAGVFLFMTFGDLSISDASPIISSYCSSDLKVS